MEQSADRHLVNIWDDEHPTAKRPPIPSFHPLHRFDNSNELSDSQSLTSSSHLDDQRLTQNKANDNGSHVDFPEKENDHEEGLGSVSSSFSTDEDESSDDGEDGIVMSLQERMLRNQERNTHFLKSLNEKYQMVDGGQPTTKGNRKRKSTTIETMEMDDKPRGMLRKVAKDAVATRNEEESTLAQRLQSLMKQYPNRESQLHRLVAILHGSIGACSGRTSTVHVPAPIFISGPPGTGKTSVVRGAVKALQAENLRSAYLHCVTLEPASVERLVVDAYKQLCCTAEIHFGRLRRHKGHRHGTKQPYSPISQAKTIISPKTPRTVSATDTATQPPLTNLPDAADTVTDDQQPRLQPRRAVKEALYGAPGHPKSSVTLNPRKKPTVKAKSSIEQDHESNNDQVETSHSAIVAFGRSLGRHFGPGSGRAAVLVLDHAERLLTLSGRKKATDRSNCLAELLLLPKVMRLNLTIVVISRFSLLQHTRLDNLASAEKSTSTLAGGVAGITIQFPAYKTQQALIQVLKTEKLLPLVIGKWAWHRSSRPFEEKVIDGFLSALVQFLSDTSMDISDFVRVGRSLWPVYIQSLAPGAISQSLRSLEIDLREDETPNEKYDSTVVGLLFRRFFAKVGKHSKVLTSLPMDSNGSSPSLSVEAFKIHALELPFLRTCLLLAAFICQKNRAENDKKVFSVHGNGKRRKSRKGTDTNDEEVAFASAGSGIERLKALRPRPFLVERVFSIFVTLVRLNPDSAPNTAGACRVEFSPDSLGTARLYDDFRSLIDLGFIHEATFVGNSKGEEVNLNAGKFWCSLTDQEASDLASTVRIPLESYLVS